MGKEAQGSRRGFDLHVTCYRKHSPCPRSEGACLQALVQLANRNCVFAKNSVDREPS